MAKKEALHDLQSRLAGRLQAGSGGSDGASWLAVRAGQGRYLLPLAQAGEIFPGQVPTPVPHAKPWFLGVVNLRGSLQGVVDIPGFLGEDPARDVAWNQVRLVTLHADLDVNCALVIDRLEGLRQAQGLTAVEAGGNTWGARYADAQGNTWQELDLGRLAQSVDFLNIGA